MVAKTLPFVDTIVKASDLRNRQKYWLDKAAAEPITVTNGDNSLTILNRKTMSSIMLQQYYSMKALEYCNAALHGEKNNVFSWLEYLDTEEQRQFHDEFIHSVLNAIKTEDWTDVKDLIDDWQATAEVEHRPEVVKALKAKIRKDELVTIKQMGNYEIKASSSIAKDWQKMESELPEAMDECKKFLQRSPANRLQSGGKLKKLQGKHKGKLQYDIDDSHRVWYEVDKKKRIITVKYIGSHP